MKSTRLPGHTKHTLLCLLGVCLLLLAACGGGVGQVCNTNEDCGPLTNCVSAACVPSTIMGESAPPLPWDGAPALDASPPEPHPPEGPAQDATKGCEEGTKRPCYTGPVGTAGVGLCKAGIQTCQDGEWQACEGMQLPLPARCDSEDRNCDGKPDNADGCQCTSGEKRPCYRPSTDKERGCTDTQGGFDCKEPCRAGIQTCVNRTWAPTCEGAIYAKEEICDSTDSNCDGQIDNITPKECYTGTPDTKNVGICKVGQTVCKNGKKECEGEINKGKEICDAENKDEDCNGSANEGCNCISGTSRECFAVSDDRKDVGDCTAGKQECVSGQWGKCQGAGIPSNETCDGKDNDCNGQIDETYPEQNARCTLTKAGVCKDGVKACENGKIVCHQAVPSSQEVCDGLDNDCDGNIDEDFSNKNSVCYAGQYACKQAGKYVCSDDKQTTVCDAVPLPPQKELCDGKDNDCNGQSDENYPSLGQECSVGLGACARKGVFVCNKSQDGVICDATPGQGSNETCDGKDNDCDGQIDNGITCNCNNGDTRPCGSDVGECKKGTQTCQNGNWGSCVGEVGSKDEACDNKDNDCDGKVDEFFRRCFSGSSGCTKQIDGNYKCEGTCANGYQRCDVGSWGKCQRETTPIKELCNGKDDDCDGQTDEDFKLGEVCEVGKGECRRTGVTVCAGDQQQTICNVRPGSPAFEVCDGKDNNCDGLVDNNVRYLTLCPKQKGVCAGAKQVCKAGALVCDDAVYQSNTKQKYEVNEVTCDRIDNDCDGVIDEKCGKTYPYFRIKPSQSTPETKDFSTNTRSGTLTTGYGLKSTKSGHDCQKSVLIATANTSQLTTKTASVGYSCSLVYRDEFVVVPQSYGNKGLQFNKTLPVNLIMPTDGTYGKVKCKSDLSTGFKLKCTLDNLKGPQGARLEQVTNSAGLFKLTGIPECKDPDFPVFANRFESSSTTPALGTVRSYAYGDISGGKCEFYTFDEEGKPKHLSFSYWIPPRGLLQWVKVDDKGQYAASENSQKANWTITKKSDGQIQIGHVGWQQTQSLVLLAPHFDVTKLDSSAYTGSFTEQKSMSTGNRELVAYINVFDNSGNTKSAANGFHMLLLPIW